MAIRMNLDVMMAKRKIGADGIVEGSRYHDGQSVNPENNKAKAVRFTTLEALCKALHCQPGDLIEYVEEEEERMEKSRYEVIMEQRRETACGQSDLRDLVCGSFVPEYERNRDSGPDAGNLPVSCGIFPDV